MTDLTGRGSAATLTRGIVWVIFGIAVLAGLAGLASGIGSIVTTLSSGQLSTLLSVSQGLPDAASAGEATLVAGSYETARVLVADLTPAAVIVSTIARVFGLLSQVAVAASFALLCWSLVRGVPFRRSLSFTITLSGGIVLIAGLVSAGLGVFSSWLIAEQLNGADEWWPIAASTDPGFLLFGFGLMFVGLAFDHGVKLQRETAGLI
ncbi:hypothetical protein EYE40_11390 [Glaciihabitans arcticus]|uniref:DUF2975 domain-containing protein n=1 Tax=Glaciihabitans arcticus TaxID=2668039 RepID=A0A4Q9GYR9_9MICO|nr:hypothetical protein [Glaciihabitans arcticus]TBN57953.1 hypothetical protein EYE40_11390 [Glaciihabitans arcticus]